MMLKTRVEVLHKPVVLQSCQAVVDGHGPRDLCFPLHGADQNFVGRVPAAPAAQLVDILGFPPSRGGIGKSSGRGQHA